MIGIMKEWISYAIAILAMWVPSVFAEEPDDTRIIDQILATRSAILKSSMDNKTNSAIFIVIWDFDGTILKGDCSEGLVVDGKTIYAGLVQVAIEKDLSELYSPNGGFERFWTDYTNMDARIGHWLAYPFIPQMLRGANAESVSRLSQQYFSNTLSNYLMASSVKIIRALERENIQSHIVSAAPDIFVKGAALTVGIPAAHIHGIEVRIRDGRLTEELMYPVTWNVGKRDRVGQLCKEIEQESGSKRVYVLAGFGDSYHTDGPFLKWIATQSLPAGKPVAVFYESKGPEPEEYKGLFYHARHSALISRKSD